MLACSFKLNRCSWKWNASTASPWTQVGSSKDKNRKPFPELKCSWAGRWVWGSKIRGIYPLKKIEMLLAENRKRAQVIAKQETQTSIQLSTRSPVFNLPANLTDSGVQEKINASPKRLGPAQTKLHAKWSWTWIPNQNLTDLRPVGMIFVR